MSYQLILEDATNVFNTVAKYQPEKQWVVSKLPKLLETIYQLKENEKFCLIEHSKLLVHENENAISEFFTFMPYLSGSSGLLTMTLELADGTVVEPGKGWLHSSQQHTHIKHESETQTVKIPFVYVNEQPYYDDEVFIIFRRNSKI